MSKLIMWNLVTLDGFFEGTKSWDLEFHQSVWGKELEQISLERLHSADGLVFGRVTYEGMAAYWKTAQGEIAELMNRLPKTVFSRSLDRADWANTTLVKDNVEASIQRLKQQGDGDLFVFGSADLSASLMEHALFDEYRLAFAPVLLGQGRRLFDRERSCLKLKLIEARPLSTGGIILRYEPERSRNGGAA
jgi:dihydrofolate reductase